MNEVEKEKIRIRKIRLRDYYNIPEWLTDNQAEFIIAWTIKQRQDKIIKENLYK